MTRPWKSYQVIEATEEEWAFFAGFFQGEGSIRISKRYQRSRSLKPSHCQVVITVSQVDPAILYWIRDHFGGSIRMRTQGQKSFSAGKTIGVWYVSSLKGCSLLLRGMLPYLQGEKAIEARLALVACRVPRISVEDQDRCYELLRKMRARARRTIRDSY